MATSIARRMGRLREQAVWAGIAQRLWLAAAALGLSAIGPSLDAVAASESARESRWVVAAPGPCAPVRRGSPCAEGACSTETSVGERFDPSDVAASSSTPAAVPGFSLSDFRGPGSCADPSTPCGGLDGGRLPERPRSPATGPGGVVESPTGPGSLPGGSLPGGGLP